MALAGAVIIRLYIADFLYCQLTSTFLPVLRHHPPTHWVTILIRLTYASIFSREAFLLGMLGHWRWRQQAIQICYLPTNTALCSRRLKPLKAKVTARYKNFRTVGWCTLHNFVAFHLVYTACHLLWRSSASIRKPKYFLGGMGQATKQNSSFDRTTEVWSRNHAPNWV